MTKPVDTIRVVIPLTVRKRNGRPKILPPENIYEQEARSQDPHIMKALGRAWAWRRRLESGEVGTAGELAELEGFTERFVSRTVRLAYMSPQLIQGMVLARLPPVLSLPELIALMLLPWKTQSEQMLIELHPSDPKRKHE